MILISTPLTKQPEFRELEQWQHPHDVATHRFSIFSPMKWENCRERFSGPMKKEGFTGFYFSHDEDKGDAIAQFIFKTEEILNLAEKTTYTKTTCNKVLKIHMSDFWMASYVRRSLFTILPRLGNHYNGEKDNYEKSIFSPSRSPSLGYVETLPAVKRFLYGFTTYDGIDPVNADGSTYLETNGWCRMFKHSDSWKKLIKENNRPTPVGVGKLWG